MLGKRPLSYWLRRVVSLATARMLAALVLVLAGPAMATPVQIDAGGPSITICAAHNTQTISLNELLGKAPAEDKAPSQACTMCVVAAALPTSAPNALAAARSFLKRPPAPHVASGQALTAAALPRPPTRAPPA